MFSIQQPSLVNSTKAQPTAANPFPLELPPKLIKKILDLDMAELLSDFWDTEECSHSHGSSRKHLITNILLGMQGILLSMQGILLGMHYPLECYVALISVLATRYPLHTVYFMAYQRTIVKAHWSFVLHFAKRSQLLFYDACA